MRIVKASLALIALTAAFPALAEEPASCARPIPQPIFSVPRPDDWRFLPSKSKEGAPEAIETARLKDKTQIEIRHKGCEYYTLDFIFSPGKPSASGAREFLALLPQESAEGLIREARAFLARKPEIRAMDDEPLQDKPADFMTYISFRTDGQGRTHILLSHGPL